MNTLLADFGSLESPDLEESNSVINANPANESMPRELLLSQARPWQRSSWPSPCFHYTAVSIHGRRLGDDALESPRQEYLNGVFKVNFTQMGALFRLFHESLKMVFDIKQPLTIQDR